MNSEFVGDYFQLQIERAFGPKNGPVLKQCKGLRWLGRVAPGTSEMIQSKTPSLSSFMSVTAYQMPKRRKVDRILQLQKVFPEATILSMVRTVAR